MYRYLIKSYIALLVLALSVSCSDSNNDPDYTFSSLVWSDEFDSDGSPNPQLWSYDIGRGTNGWGNNELQYYTNRLENVQIEDGLLKITSRKEAFEGAEYTSARIQTKGIFERTFGRYEARIKLPFGQGIWPAFWLLGDDSDGTVIWPQIGEIDIMEYRGQQPTIIHGSIHGPGYSAGGAVTDSYILTGDRFDTGFNLFAIEWGPDFIDFYVNDILYNTITRNDVGENEWVFNDNTFYIILNVAVGGSFVGPPTGNTPFPQTMYVDYVRVYGMDN